MQPAKALLEACRFQVSNREEDSADRRFATQLQC